MSKSWDDPSFFPSVIQSFLEYILSASCVPKRQSQHRKAHVVPASRSSQSSKEAEAKDAIINGINHSVFARVLAKIMIRPNWGHLLQQCEILHVDKEARGGLAPLQEQHRHLNNTKRNRRRQWAKKFVRKKEPVFKSVFFCLQKMFSQQLISTSSRMLISKIIRHKKSSFISL